MKYELWCQACCYPSMHNVKQATCPVCRAGRAVYLGKVEPLDEKYAKSEETW